jgi:UDP:flavonoid glycosyltransferase YjiC (YdhE family)
VVPFGRDQFEVAARVAAVGAGTCLMPDALNADTLRRAVGEAIGMRPGAQAIADALAQSGGAAAAAAALESQLSVAIEGAELR